MQVTFWGTRGSIASPGPDTLKFGGNTSCVELRAANETIIFDSGTGIRSLGNDLLARQTADLKVHLFISHVHWDHIQGFPFFGPLFVPGSEIVVFGPQEQHQRLSTTMAGQMQYRYFPVDIEQLSAKLEYHELGEERVHLGPILIRSLYLNHTTLSMAYKVELGSHSVVYATDTESYAQRPRAWADPDRRTFFHRRDEELAEFFRGADLLILDSQYSAQEYATKIGWGHGTFDYAVDLAISAGVETLAIYHHDPNRTDAQLQLEIERFQRRATEDGSSLKVIGAAEHMTIEVPDEQAPVLEPAIHVIPSFVQQVHVGLVEVSANTEDLSRQALQVTHFKLQSFESIGALEDGQVHEFRPNLLLLQCRQRGDVARALAAIRRTNHRRKIPLLALVPPEAPKILEEAFKEGATDVMVEPFTPSQLRSRVDTWLFRGGVALDRRRHPRRNGDDEPMGASL